ncbi:MAG TPA: hypothetical protein VG796_15565 [Verrucomicrobiales bacterium]|nr:hypothetical protein [Verrucomicrobiales bacterium]
MKSNAKAAAAAPSHPGSGGAIAGAGAIVAVVFGSSLIHVEPHR